MVFNVIGITKIIVGVVIVVSKGAETNVHFGTYKGADFSSLEEIKFRIKTSCYSKQCGRSVIIKNSLAHSKGSYAGNGIGNPSNIQRHPVPYFAVFSAALIALRNT